MSSRRSVRRAKELKQVRVPPTNGTGRSRTLFMRVPLTDAPDPEAATIVASASFADAGLRPPVLAVARVELLTPPRKARQKAATEWLVSVRVDTSRAETRRKVDQLMS